MSSSEKKPSQYEISPEIIIGLVGGLGTDFDKVYKILKKEFKKYSYESSLIKLSDFVLKNEKYHSEIEQIAYKMKECTNLRKQYKCNGILGLLSIVEIFKNRKNLLAKKQNYRQVYVLRSLKRKEEVETLKKVYGVNFILLSVYSSEEHRKNHLKTKQNLSHTERKRVKENIEKLFVPCSENMLIDEALIRKDESETETSIKEYGQDVINTFSCGHFFLNIDDKFQNQVKRFCKLIFNAPFITPTRDEMNMFLAKGKALQSSFFSRQIGAVITNNDGDVIATGVNEVPKFGGGIFWENDKSDCRDFTYKLNREEIIKILDKAEALIKIEIEKILIDEKKEETRNKIENVINAKLYDFELEIKKLYLNKGEKVQDYSIHISKCFNELIREINNELPIKKLKKKYLEPMLKKSLHLRIDDSIEFYRTMHAEECAIINAAFRGVSVKGCTLYCTTFPCHLCAKKIISAGIKRVVYIDPYPKSRTKDMFEDLITLKKSHKKKEKKAIFEPYIGVSPKKFIYIFKKYKNERLDETDEMHIKLKEINPHPKPKYKKTFVEYIIKEIIFIKKLNDNYHDVRLSVTQGLNKITGLLAEILKNGKEAKIKTIINICIDTETKFLIKKKK